MRVQARGGSVAVAVAGAAASWANRCSGVRTGCGRLDVTPPHRHTGSRADASAPLAATCLLALVQKKDSAKSQMRSNLYQTHIRRFHSVMNEYNTAAHGFKQDLQGAC